MFIYTLDENNQITSAGEVDYTEEEQNQAKDAGFYFTDKKIVYILDEHKFYFEDELSKEQEDKNAIANLNILKNKKISNLKAYRINQEIQPLQIEEGSFDIDDKSILRLQSALVQLQDTDNYIEWTLADNTSINLTYDIIKKVLSSLAKRNNDIHNEYLDVKNKILNCSTEEELQEYTLGEEFNV